MVEFHQVIYYETRISLPNFLMQKQKPGWRWNEPLLFKRRDGMSSPSVSAAVPDIAATARSFTRLPDKSRFRLRESIKKFRLGILHTLYILPVSPTSPPPDRRTTLPTFFDRRHQTRGSTALLDDILVERDLVSSTFHRLFKVLLLLWPTLSSNMFKTLDPTSAWSHFRSCLMAASDFHDSYGRRGTEMFPRPTSSLSYG